ncbi:MAG: hypothetical protein RLZZ184_3739 [Cyanobacteriota bacterium]|jgi:hypothetical protein
MNEAWSAQSASLIEVQKKGGNLEEKIKNILNWDSGRVIYDHINNYDIQIDNVYPSKKSPEVVVSVTYTEPNTKGHSNENKLQLKVGELALTKFAYPECIVILVIGGSQESWLPYVLEAFKFFFDEVVYLWNEDGIERLNQIKLNPICTEKKHTEFWSSLTSEWSNILYKDEGFKIPCGLLRYKIADKIKNQDPPVDHPELVNSRIASLCLHRSKRKGGREWENFRARKWNSIEESRSFFNPLESLVEITLSDAGFEFAGGIAHDVPVPSFLHDLGMTNTLLSEDFVLFSEKYNKKVYIQCKASGGGRQQHGKNIQNRSKEQITRGIFYRSKLNNGIFSFCEKDFIWISVLDGNWGVTKRSPLKYIHMLQHAGYDFFIGSEELIDYQLEPLAFQFNPLAQLLSDLKCRKK